jgi:hypothetical protein
MVGEEVLGRVETRDGLAHGVDPALGGPPEDLLHAHAGEVGLDLAVGEHGPEPRPVAQVDGGGVAVHDLVELGAVEQRPRGGVAAVPDGRSDSGLRGVQLTGAVILMTELGDITRFDNPRQLRARWAAFAWAIARRVPQAS